MVPDPDIGHARPIFRQGIIGQGRKPILDFPRLYWAGDRGTPGHAGHVILGDHTEYLTGPGFQGPRIDSRIVGLESLKGNIVWGRVFTIHAVVNLADGLPSRLGSSNWVGRALGLSIPPSAPWRVLWYQLFQAPSPTPSLSGGRSTGPPEVACFPPLPAEAGLLPWLGVDVFPPWFKVDVFPPWFEVDVFPPWFEVDVFPPWFEVDVFPPWFEVDFFPPQSEVGWPPS